MNQRAYYRDAFTTRFTATIRQSLEIDGRPAVILDRTYFYPTSGGQPHDTGLLWQVGQTARVIDVFEHEDGEDAVVHVLDSTLSTGEVAAEIDWARRFDHMQQHTGQHILSQAFIRVAGANTVSFHLSGDSVTIDLDQNTLNTDQIAQVESLANEIVWEDREVRVLEVSTDEAKQLSLRKIPPGRNGSLRLIDIEDFDITACGGTHVARTGAVGMIIVVKTERRGQLQRVEFRCGRRALDDYHLKHDTIQLLTNQLTTSIDDLALSVARLQAENKQLRTNLKRSHSELLALEAKQLLIDAEQVGPWHLVKHVFRERDATDVRLLGNTLTNVGGVIALLGVAGEQAQLVFCRSADAPGMMGDLIRPSLELLGSARGGGGPAFAQGGGPPADETSVAEAIGIAAVRLREALNEIE